MLSFLEFINESELKNVPYYFSFKFRNFLNEILKEKKPGWEIAYFILHSEDSNQVEDDITFVDMTETNDKVSFIQLNRLSRMFDVDKVNYKHPIELQTWIDLKARDEEHTSWKTQRTELSIGRFVNRVYLKSGKSIDDKSREIFVNTYKSKFDFLKSGDLRFEMIGGDYIVKWYLESNYEDTKGQLGNSCMRYNKCSTFFDIYTKNEESVSLLILKSETPNKISGRALVWKLTDGMTYMDRIYTIRDSDAQLFIDYAEKRGWISYETIDSSKLNKLTVKLKNWMFDEYPYMDTFKFLNKDKGILLADEDVWPSKGIWRLQSTSGSYETDNLVYSEYHDEYIESDSAVRTYSGDWVLRDSAIWLEYKDCYATDADGIRWSEYDQQYYFEDDCAYSEIMQDDFYSEDAIKIYVNSDGEWDWIHKDFEKSLVDIEIDGEMVKTLPAFTIFDPIDQKYYFKDIKSKFIELIVQKAKLLKWEEVEKQILNSTIDFEKDKKSLEHLKTITRVQVDQGLRLFRPYPSGHYHAEQLLNIMKCMLIISPTKPGRAFDLTPVGTNLESKNVKLIEKIKSNPELTKLIPEDFLSKVENLYSYKSAFKSAIILAEQFLPYILKDPNAIATYYSVKYL